MLSPKQDGEGVAQAARRHPAQPIVCGAQLCTFSPLPRCCLPGTAALVSRTLRCSQLKGVRTSPGLSLQCCDV
eukprot:1063848-Rhodomonas_salina.3